MLTCLTHQLKPRLQVLTLACGTSRPTGQGTLRITRGRGPPPSFPLPIPHSPVTASPLRCYWNNVRGGETQEPKCPPQKHLAWAPTGPHTPTGEKGHPGKNLPMLLAIACKKTVFTSCKTGNGYEHGPLPSPNQPSFYREVAPHDPFQQTEGKLGTIGSPPAPGSSQ